MRPSAEAEISVPHLLMGVQRAGRVTYSVTLMCTCRIDIMSTPSQVTIPIDPDQEVIGYIINSALSKTTQERIAQIQTKLSKAFPGAIWVAPPDSLHITLMDWSAPLVDYGQDKDELFRSFEAEYIQTLTEIIKAQQPIQITFDTLEVHPAAIIVKGYDDGSYQNIRKRFLEKITLTPGTKMPPQIVHTTICKFLKEINVDEVRHMLESEAILLEERVTEFRLVRETQIFLQSYKTLREFPLT